MLNPNVSEFFLFLGIQMIALAMLIKTPLSKHLAFLGSLIYSIYWVLVIPTYLNAHDYVNVMLCALSLPIFSLIGLCYLKAGDVEHYEYFYNLVWLSSLPYVLVSRIPIISGAIIKAVAINSTQLLNVFGFNYSAGEVMIRGWPYYSPNPLVVRVPIIPTSISLIFPCTAFQAMAIFGAAVIASSAPIRKKTPIFLTVILLIYTLNIIRNAGVIYMIDVLGYSFELAHNQIGKAGSLIALILLAYFVIRKIPDIGEKLNRILDDILHFGSSLRLLKKTNMVK